MLRLNRNVPCDVPSRNFAPISNLDILTFMEILEDFNN